MNERRRANVMERRKIGKVMFAASVYACACERENIVKGGENNTKNGFRWTIQWKAF